MSPRSFPKSAIAKRGIALALEAHLIYWDQTYEKVSCLLSAKDKPSRADWIQYIEFYWESTGDTIDEKKESRNSNAGEKRRKSYHNSTMDRIFFFVIQQKRENVLASTQARLPQNLKHMSLSGDDVMVV